MKAKVKETLVIRSYSTTTIYNVPYKNVNIQLGFNELAKFWSAYPKQLDVTLGELIGDTDKLSEITTKLASLLQPLGLNYIEVTDKHTHAGLRVSDFKEELKCAS